MTLYMSNTVIDLSSTENLRQDGPTSRDYQHPSASAHLLDDDSLLIIFSFCRPVILDELVASGRQLLEGGEWNRERWWHRLIQVCRRWRYLLLDSAFHLQVSLVCARGTPVADMLAHSPPALPLIIDHFDDKYQDLTAEDEKGILLALQHRERIRRIRILKPTPILQKLIVALDGEFPILEFLLIWHRRYYWPLIEPITNFNLPETFRAPHLRRLLLKNFATPIESPQLTTMGNLVTLFLTKIPSSAYFHPNTLLQRLSVMPQLETLWIGFSFSREAERQLSRTPIVTRVTHHNLRWLGFRGTSTYLEAFFPWLATPLLQRLDIYLFNRMIYSIPHLRHFMKTARNFQVKTVKLYFEEDYLRVLAYPDMGTRLDNLDMALGGRRFDWQIVSAAQVFQAFSTVFSEVEHLIFDNGRKNMSSERNNQADLTHWRKLLEPFGNVKNLTARHSGLSQRLSGALQPGEDESPTELLPELQKLSHSARGDSRNVFTQFVDARQKAGRPITVVHL